MSKTHQKIELVANILIIVVALLLGGVLVQKYFFASSSQMAANQPRVEPKVGAKMEMRNVNFTEQPKTLVLALQTGCRFCNDSAPFYKRVIESVKDKNVKLVAVFPTAVEESAAHLSKIGLSNMEVKQSPLKGLDVSGTPTLILTNEKGEITDYWVGKLPPDKEAEVLNKLNS
jgi:thioredoxin-related protein